MQTTPISFSILPMNIIQSAHFTFVGRLCADSFIAFARHRAARLDLAVDVGAASNDAITLTVRGDADLVDAFEMACSLGPQECLILDVKRNAPDATWQERMMSNADDWYPLALSASIDPATSAGTRLQDRELVIWRDASGVAHVWEDRCPHRGMKLSFGFVRGDHIACLYHGWQYDRGGYCQYIPAHPDLDVPKSITVSAYPAREHCGMIWTALSDTSATPPGDDAQTLPLRSIHLGCSVEAAVAALKMSLAPFAPDRSADTVVDRVSAHLYAVSCGHDRLLVGVQAISNTRTALHLVISGAPSVYEGAGQHHFMTWVLALRHAIEHPRKLTNPMPSIAAMAAV